MPAPDRSGRPRSGPRRCRCRSSGRARGISLTPAPKRELPPVRPCRRRCGSRPRRLRELLDPVGQREIGPSRRSGSEFSVRPRRRVDRTAEADPDAPHRPGAMRVLHRAASRNGLDDLAQDCRTPGPPGSTLDAAPRRTSRRRRRPESELELGTADLDAQQPGSAMTSARRRRRCVAGTWPEIRRYRSSMIQWKTTWCSDSTIPMSSIADVEVVLGQRLELAAAEAGDADRRQPVALAHSTALRMFGLLPEPEIASSRSPGEARFLSCSTKIRS